jgi:hypothetical protein
MSQHEIEPLDTDLKDLLEAERQRPGAPAGARQRVLSRVHATLALGGLGDPQGFGDPIGSAPRGPDAPPPGPELAPGLEAAGAGMAAGKLALGSLLAKTVAVGLGVVALGGGLVAGMVWTSGPAAQPAPVATAAAPAAPPVTPAPLPDAVTEPAAQTPGADAPAAPIRAPAASSAAPAPQAEAQGAPAGRDVDLAAERAQLEEARRAIAGGRSGAAFEALARHARSFPRGRLSEEREALWIQALVGAGRVDEARDRAAAFRRRFPRSMLLPALEAALGTIP